MTSTFFPHPENEDVPIKLPLFRSDYDQCYTLFALRSVTRYLTNSSKYFPLGGIGVDWNGLYLFDNPFYIAVPTAKDYVDILFNYLHKYSDTDYHQSLNNQLPSGFALGENILNFPTGYNITESEEDLVFTCPARDTNYLVTITALYNYKHSEAYATSVNDYKVCYCPVDAGKSQMLRLPKKIEDESPLDNFFLNYGSVVISVSGLEPAEAADVEMTLKSQIMGDEQYFLAENFESLLQLMDAKIFDFFGPRLFQVPKRIHFQQHFGIRITGVRVPFFDNPAFTALMEQNVIDLRTEFENLGISQYVIDSNYANGYLTHTGIDYNMRSEIGGDTAHIRCTVAGTPRFVTSIEWVEIPSRYRNYALIRPMPPALHMEGERRNDDIFSNAENDFWIEGERLTFRQPTTVPFSFYGKAAIYFFDLDSNGDAEFDLFSRTFIRADLIPLPEPEWSNDAFPDITTTSYVSPERDFISCYHPEILHNFRGWIHHMPLAETYQLNTSGIDPDVVIYVKFCSWTASDTVPDKEGNFAPNWDAQAALNVEDWRTEYFFPTRYSVDVLETRTESFTAEVFVLEDPVFEGYKYNGTMTKEEFYLSLL